MNTKGKKTRNILAFALIPIILTCFCSIASAQGTPPAPTFQRVIVRSDDRLPPTGLRWNLIASVVGPSPADIVELKVTEPGGFQYTFTEADIIQGEELGLYFFHATSTNLPNGTYTFTVTDKQERTATQDFDFINPSTAIPRVESSTMSPPDNSYVNTTTPTFSWTGVESGYYYRIMIMDWNSKTDAVYYSDYTQDTQITVPSGYLLPNTPYKWRVDVFDAPWNNRSRSETLRFSTGSASYALDLAFGIVWGDNSYYYGFNKVLCADIMGPLPNHVTEMKVTGPGGISHSFMESDIQYDLVTEGIQVCLGEAGFPADGDYIFSVKDILDNSDNYIKTDEISSELPIVSQASLSPTNNAYLYTLTPTFTWTRVAGSNLYYRVKINDWMGRYTVYNSPRSKDPYATIPLGILDPNRSYKWRVEVFDNPDGLEADSRSSGAWNSFTIVSCVGEVILNSPSGTIATSTPTYTWNPDPSATWYQLVVADSTGTKIQQWYSAADAKCPAGTGTCSVTPTTAVAAGAAQWKVQTYGTCGLGAWSAPMSFTVKCLDPATLVSPSGEITDSTPDYSWNAVSGAMWYQLVVTDSTGTKIQQWNSAATICSTGTCKVTPTTAVAAGAAQWKVQTYGACGFGSWSAPMSFTMKCLDIPTLVSPSGEITDNTPEYIWNEVSGAMWYQLVVTDSTGIKIQQWNSAATICSAGTCKVTPATAVAAGAAQWKVQTYGACGFGSWSAPMSFTLKCLDVPTLVSPSGEITDSTPEYIWNAVSGAMWYQLVVTDSTGTKIQQWYSAADAKCPTGTGTCSVTPATAVAAGAAQWKVQTYGACGFGSWSAPMSFTLKCLDVPTLIEPFGERPDSTPEYIWEAVSGAMWYQLVVTDSTGIKIQQWYSATDAKCPTGTGSCSATPTIAVAGGAAQWKVQTYGACGFGSWSAPMSFTLRCPDVPTLVSPSGEITDSTPEYSWFAVSGAMWYQLVVNDSTGIKIQQWYPAADLDCPDIPDVTSICSVTPITALAAGAYQWKVQTYSSCGLGAWSSGMNFNIVGASLYDDFSATYINKDKWKYGELVREIDVGTKRLLLKQASPNPAMITSYPFAESHWLSFPNPNSINSIQADVTVLESSITNSAKTRARLAGTWYSTATPGGPGLTGDIWANVELRETSAGLFAQWSLGRCTNSDCTTSDYSRGGNFSVPISLGKTYTLYNEYDSANHRFKFRVNNEEIIFDAADLPTRVGDAFSPQKGISTRVEIDNATSSSYITAAFDNVYKNGSLHDDFSSSAVNPTKWTAYELVREISGGKFRSKVRSSSGYTSSVNSRLEFLYPSSTNALQARVTPLIYQSDQGTYAWARIGGYFYHDGTQGTGRVGEVGAQVFIGGDGTSPVAGWAVWRETDEAGSAPEILNSGAFATPISLPSPYTLFLGWDGSQFTFKINDEVAYYVPTTTINSPNLPWKNIGTQILNPAGKEATIEALFDDVVVYYSPPRSAAKPISPSGTIINTTPAYTWSAVPEATWYQLYVNDSTGNKIQQWYSASTCGCASGTGNCSMTPSTVLASGTGNWRILTWNPAGLGPWSSSMPFTVPGVGFGVYDDFSGTYISKDKWREGELVREIDGGKLLFKHANPSPVVVAGYPNTTWNTLNFSDPNSVNSIQADVTIHENTITNSALTRTRIGGKWYNDGTAGEGTIGDVWAEVSIRKDSGGLYARWEIAKMTNPDGTTTSGVGGGNFTTPINVGTVYQLYIGYNSGTHQFLFKIDDQEITFGPTGLPPNAEVPKQPSKEMTTRVQVNNAISSGYIAATFDNVYKNDSSYDDFSSFTIDQTKWTNYESVREISEGKLRSKVRSSSASTSPINNTLALPYPLSTNYLETKVTLLDYENPQGLLQLAGISGTFYNDGTPGAGLIGDVVAEVYIGGTGANPVAAWRVYKYTDAGGTSMTPLASGTFITPVTLASKNTLSLGWDGTRFIFKFDNEAAYYAPVTTINQPKIPFKRLRTVFFPETNKKEAVIEALFDDVRVCYSPPSSAATQVSPSGTTSMIPTYRWNAVSTATEYYLFVNDSTGNKIQKWYTAAEAGCGNGTGTCSVSPTTVLSLGAGQWWVQTKNTSGTGPWSSGMSFIVYPIPGATLISPAGATADTTPTYTWNAVPEAVSYQLMVNDCSGPKTQQSYTPSVVGCASGGPCSATPTTEVFGSSQWWIRTYGIGGYGPWSNPLSFSTPSPLPTGQSYWSGSFRSNGGDSGGLYASITRSGNTVSALLTVIDPVFGPQTIYASGTVSGNTFNMSGITPEGDPLILNGTVSCNVITGTYTITGEDSGVFTLYKN